jgi:hypothetical protein
MNTSTFLSIYLVLHITGFTMMVGTVFADYIISRRLNRYLITDKSRAVGVLDGAAGFPRMIGIGAALLLVTGIAMVSIFREAVTSMLWFRIKMILVVLVALNGAVIVGRGERRLKALLEAHDDRNNGRILALKERLGVFHGISLFLFLVIFILSVFKF